MWDPLAVGCPCLLLWRRILEDKQRLLYGARGPVRALILGEHVAALAVEGIQAPNSCGGDRVLIRPSS